MQGGKIVLLTGAGSGLGFHLYKKLTNTPWEYYDVIGLKRDEECPKYGVDVLILNHASWTPLPLSREVIENNLLTSIDILRKVHLNPGGQVIFILTQDTPKKGLGVSYKVSKAALEYLCKCLNYQWPVFKFKGVKVPPMFTKMWVGPLPKNGRSPEYVAEKIVEEIIPKDKGGIFWVH